MMDILEQIGQLSIFHIGIPLILLIIVIYKIKKGRKAMKEQKKDMAQSEIVEPATISDLKMEPTKKPVKPPKVYYPSEGEEVMWNRVFMALGIIALFIFSIAFFWGVINDKFASSSSVACSDFPEIPNCPVCPPCPNDTLICREVFCPNISCSCPPVNVYINQTNSSV